MTAEHSSQTTQVIPNNWIHPLSQTEFDENHVVKQLGGKGASLVNLIKAGFPVPDGFVITTEAYLAFITETGLDDFIIEQIAEDTSESFARIAAQIGQTEIPSALKQAIEEAFTLSLGHETNNYFAVRSSGIDEDSATHSFAGQHHTGLYIQGFAALLEEVKQCWASIWSTSSRAYRIQRLGRPEPVAMGVVVQRMIDSELSGVAFGQIPTTGDTCRFMIEACYGLGEGLVSGRVCSDSLMVNKQTLVVEQHDVRYKLSKMVCHEGKVCQQTVAEEIRQQPALNALQIQALGQLLQATESYFKAPQDVEWAYSRGHFFLLQSRPITTVATVQVPVEFYQGSESEWVQDNTIWSRMDIGEIFTGRMSPLGISFARYYQYKVHRECGKGLGLLDLGNTPDYMAYHKGHVYLNVSYAAYLLSQTPVGENQFDFLHRFSSEEVNLTGYQNPYGNPFKFVQSKWTHRLFWIQQNLKELFTAKQRARKMVESRFREFDYVQTLDLKAMDTTQLRETMNHALDYFKLMHQGYLPFYINAFGFYGLLEHLCQSWLKQDGKNLQNRLKGDLSNLRTVACAAEVWGLCQQLKKMPELEVVFLNQSVEEVIQVLHTTESGKWFWEQPMKLFLRQNGVRAREEMELTNPRWIDDPTYLITMIQVYLKQGYDIDQHLRASHQTQSIDADALMKPLPWYKKWLLQRVIALYCACGKLREETRMSMITSIWLVRLVVYEVARRLVDRQLLNSIDDIAYVQFDDILQYIYEYEDENKLFDPRKIARVKGQYRADLSQPEPPLTFIGSPPNIQQSIHATAQSLQGLGVSRGIVTAKVRVIHDLVAQAGELKRGEIIVAPYTDASWTPLFALAGGVITDIGSMLSHSAIVSREFAIPSVVNTKVATRQLKTGDEVTMNGETGLITIDQSAHVEQEVQHDYHH